MPRVDPPTDTFMLAKALYYTLLDGDDNYIKFEDSVNKDFHLHRAEQALEWLSRAEYWLVYAGMGG